MKKLVLIGVRHRRILSLILILALAVCTVLPPVKGEAAQTGESEEILIQDKESDAPDVENRSDDPDGPASGNTGSEEQGADPQAGNTPSGHETEADSGEETLQKEDLSPSEKTEESGKETVEEGNDETSMEIEGEALQEDAAEEILTDTPLLLAAEEGSVPSPLGDVTVGRSGRTPLPVSSEYVAYTRCWYVIHNNVKYWAVCARASAKGPVGPESADSVTASCKYNYLKEDVVNGLTSWQKSGEYPTTVPITTDLGYNAELAKAVMVSMFVRADIWKESFSSFTLSYAAAHLLVSDLLFGDDDGARGENYDLVFHQMKSKVQKWMEDPKNAALMDSCTAYIAYLWGSTMAKGRQPVIWVEGLPGVMDIQKNALDPDGNPLNDRDLTGTVYTLYTDSECRNGAKDIYGNDAVFVCDASGNAPSLVIPIGTYYLKETKAAPGMLLDEEVYTVTLVRSTEFGNSINYVMKEVSDHEAESPATGALVIQKADSESGTARGGASLEGAVYDLIVDQEEGVTDEHGSYGQGDIYASLTTDREGRASLENIPEGTYILKEKKPSAGYRLSSEEVKVRVEKGKTVSFTGKDALPEEIIKAPFSFEKYGSDDRKMAGVAFRVTCRESGESWEIETGEDGTYDSLKEKDPSRQRLVYGTYLLEEIPCSANEGFRLCKPAEFTVGKETALDLGTFVNYRTPSAETVLTDENGNKYLKSWGKITLKDTVSLHDMYDYKGQEIRIKGILTDRETGKEITSSEKILTITSALQEAVLEFSLDASGMGGKSITAFEYIYDSSGKEIARHEDPGDEDQTVRFPGLETSAVCPETGENVLPSAGEILIRDTVSYRALEGGKNYRVEGILYDKESGEPFLAGGRQVKSSATFTADPSGQGSVTVEFAFDADEDLEGRILVAAESLYDSRGELTAEHKDLNDEKQTVYVPGIRTMAQDLMTGDHAGTLSEKTTLRDKVTYTGLSTGSEYEIKGHLTVRETGEPLIINGEKVTAARTFRPDAPEGTVFLDFTFDSSALAGKTLVCFEELFHKGKSVAVHADLKDRDQSLVYPGIRTTACDASSGDHLGISWAGLLSGHGGENAITDRAVLTGLVPGYVYKVRGVLYDREKKEALKGKDGREIRAEKEFTAASSEETVDLRFETGDAVTAAKTVVVCEDLIHNDVIIASHRDLEDEDQSIYYPGIKTEAEDASTGSHTGAAAEKAVIKDRVFYSNLIPSTEEKPTVYTMKGTLVRKSSGEPLLDRNGKEITSQAVFSPESPSGSVVLTFAFDASLLQGETLVCFEKLYREDILAAVHADLEDQEQSIYYPSVTTRASDEKTGTRTGAAREENILTDLVHYENLLPGTYVIKGVLTDAGTGLPFKDAEGNMVTAEKTFTAEEMTGDIPVSFTFRANGLAGRTLTVFETLFTESGVPVAVHEDSEDRNQMIFYPEIITEAEDVLTGSHAGTVAKEVTVTDHVWYRNLIPSTKEEPREYTLKGILMVTSTGKPLLDGNGEAVSAELVFSPETADGCADLSFTFSSALLSGETVVCFESLYENNIEAAVHADLEDSWQSIYYPSITTSASVNGEKKAAAGRKIRVEDRVEYKNLVPGTEYVLTGILMDKKTGEPLTAGGKQVRAEKSFIPEDTEGTAVMTFTFDSSGLDGKTLVVFETLYVNDAEVTCHADLEDEGQSILLTPPSNPPRTGDRPEMLFWILCALLGSAGAGVLLSKRRKET